MLLPTFLILVLSNLKDTARAMRRVSFFAPKISNSHKTAYGGGVVDTASVLQYNTSIRRLLLLALVGGILVFVFNCN